MEEKKEAADLIRKGTASPLLVISGIPCVFRTTRAAGV